jgi:hypothetical protein
MKRSTIILFDGLHTRPGVTLNIAAHLAQSITAQSGLRADGRFVDYVDKSGATYPSISWWPVIILSGRRAKMWACWDQIETLDLPRAAFFESMLEGGSEIQLTRTALLDRQDLELLGVAAFGDIATLQPITRQFSLWRT